MADVIDRAQHQIEEWVRVHTELVPVYPLLFDPERTPKQNRVRELLSRLRVGYVERDNPEQQSIREEIDQLLEGTEHVES